MKANPAKKSPTKMRYPNFLALSLTTLLLGAPSHSEAQNLFVANYGNAKVEEYSATTGAVVKDPLVGNTNSDQPTSLALSGNNLYIGESGIIEEVNASTGSVLSGTFATYASDAQYLQVSGTNLFAAGQGSGTIAEFNAQTGATESTNFLGLNAAGGTYGMATSGGYIYLVNYANTNGLSTGTINVYSASTGLLVTNDFAQFAGEGQAIAISGSALYVSYFAQSGSAWSAFNLATGTLITGFTTPADFGSEEPPQGLAVVGNNIFASFGSDVINEYSATTGALISGSYITTGLAQAGPLVVSVPEPDPFPMLVSGIALVAGALLVTKRRFISSNNLPQNRTCHKKHLL